MLVQRPGTDREADQLLREELSNVFAEVLSRDDEKKLKNALSEMAGCLEEVSDEKDNDIDYD